MRVTHVTPYFAPAFVYGGPPRSVYGLCRGLADAGLDVEVVTTTANGACDLPASAPGGEIESGIVVHRVRRSRPRLFFNAPVRSVVAEILKRTDLLHIHGLWNATEWIASAEARAHRIPYVLSPRGMLLESALRHHGWRKRLLFAAFEGANVRAASRLHATSTAEADSLARYVERSLIRIVPNGIDLPSVARTGPDVRTMAGIPAGDPIVLFMGRLHPIKRLDLLAAAVASARAAHPRLRLVIAGPDEAGTLRGLKPALVPLGSSVHVLGQVDEDNKWAWLRESSLLACCSNSENFGMSILEAMAAGTPVVVTRTCPWPEIERAGAGLWVEQTVAALADGISTVISDPGSGRRMGQNGRALVERSYSWPAVARAMNQVYEEVVARRSAAIA